MHFRSAGWLGRTLDPLQQFDIPRPSFIAAHSGLEPSRVVNDPYPIVFRTTGLSMSRPAPQPPFCDSRELPSSLQPQLRHATDAGDKGDW